MNFKTLNHSALAALMLFSCSWLTSCSDDDDKDLPRVKDAVESDFYGAWQNFNDSRNLVVFNNDHTYVDYYLDNNNHNYYEDMTTGHWQYDSNRGDLVLIIDDEREEFKLTAMSENTFSFYYKKDSEKEIESFSRISQSQLPIGPATGSGSSTQTDALSNTTWAGNVDGANIIIAFKAGGIMTETFGSEVGTGTYSLSGKSLTIDIDGILRNTYGSKYTITQTNSQLTLVNVINEKVVFTKK